MSVFVAFLDLFYGGPLYIGSMFNFDSLDGDLCTPIPDLLYFEFCSIALTPLWLELNSLF